MSSQCVCPTLLVAKFQMLNIINLATSLKSSAMHHKRNALLCHPQRQLPTKFTNEVGLLALKFNASMYVKKSLFSRMLFRWLYKQMPNTSFSTIKKYCVVTGRGKGVEGGGWGTGRKGRAGGERGGR